MDTFKKAANQLTYQRRLEEKTVKKLRLAVFNTQPPHLYFGGVERRIMETAKRLTSDVVTTVFSGTKKGFTKPAAVGGVGLVPCFSTDKLFPVDNWFFNHTVAGAADTIQADVYEAHAVSGYGFQKALRKRGIKKPFILTVHGVLADEYFQAAQRGSLSTREKLANLIMYRLSRLEAESARNANAIVTVSYYSAKKLVQLYRVDAEKIRVVPNGVDLDRFKPAPSGEELKRQIGVDDRQCILFVGRLIPRKGLSYLIEAAQRIVKERVDTAFVIVGDGPLRKQLTVNIERLGLSKNFLFLGDVSDKILPALYNCSDVFAFPSIQEGLGIALLEAQATAKPVVAFNVSGVREAVLDKETGLLVNMNSGELADAILRLLSDKSLRERMGRRGREFVSDRLSWDACARGMLKVYQEAENLL